MALTDLPGFPSYTGSRAAKHIAGLARLLRLEFTGTQYIDVDSSARLIGAMLSAYAQAVNNVRWREEELLARADQEGRRFNLLCAAAFDLAANAEYLHGRLTNDHWIYCHRGDKGSIHAYFSFLKQCPRCCLDSGLEPRLSKAQHKPASHHIGEISTVITGQIVRFISSASERTLTIASVAKQSHDVDLVGFSGDILVLFEIKSSPMVTFPACARLSAPIVSDINGEREEYRQHSLIDLPSTDQLQLSLYIPHRDTLIELGETADAGWPYPALIRHISDPDRLLDFFSAWLELYYAYQIPKERRSGRNIMLPYLVNGWGDQIDSNKTKPGLGRTDDIKKGTYQLLKFGAYYRDEDFPLVVRAALLSNLDPLFLRAAYMDELVDVRWAKGERFTLSNGSFTIAEPDLHYLYEAVIAFNAPMINDPALRGMFDFDRADQILRGGRAQPLIEQLG